MGTAQPIEPNMPDIVGAKTSKAAGSVGKFESVFDAAGYGASLAGPVAAATTAMYSPRGADIVGAAVNAAAGYGSAPGSYSGGTGAYYGGGSSNLVTGGLSYAPGGAGGGDSTITQAQDMLAKSQASSVALLMVQDEMGMQNRTFTSVSNLMNSRDTMLGSIIRNVRVG